MCEECEECHCITGIKMIPVFARKYYKHPWFRYYTNVVFHCPEENCRSIGDSDGAIKHQSDCKYANTCIHREIKPEHDFICKMATTRMFYFSKAIVGENLIDMLRKFERDSVINAILLKTGKKIDIYI